MAVFYPPYDPDELLAAERTGDHAERRVLEALSNLSDDWRVFHGLTWREVEGKGGERTGEADLVVFHPNFGILVIEVKGGGLKIKDGEWFYLSLFDGSVVGKMRISPLEQASRSRHYLFNRLSHTRLKDEILPFTAFTHAAWFPDILWQAETPPEVPNSAFILDMRDLRDPSQHLRKILTMSKPAPQRWSRPQIELLIKTVAPEANLLVPLGAALGTIRDRLFRMTEAQISALRALRSQKRLLVDGCAGSGKTLLAIQLANEHLIAGRKVLFTCFNKNLATHIGASFSGNQAIDVVNFHELVRRLCEKAGITYEVPEDPQQRAEFFNIGCAELLERCTSAVSERYDTIIVDEAYDFKDTWWIALEMLGKEEFCFYLFYDSHQNMFNDQGKWSPPFDMEPIILDRNVRNTKPVGDFALKLGGLDLKIDYAVKEGPSPIVRTYADSADLVRVLKGTLDELSGKMKVSPDDIVILCPYKWDSERLGIKEFVERNGALVSTDLTKRGRGRVRLGTIQSFKGLEADVVILCGLDGHLPACSPANLYVGATRARSMLYVVVQSASRLF